MVEFTPEVMRTRFWELFGKKEDLVAELKPLRDHAAKLREAVRGPLAELHVAQRACVAVERPRMAEIDTEMATLARALKQKVGERPE